MSAPERFVLPVPSNGGGEVFITGRDRPSSVIKTANVEADFSGWTALRRHLSMPRMRILANNLLVVKYYEGKTLTSLINEESERACEAFADFFKDLTQMWEDSAEAFDISKIKRDYAQLNLSMLPKYKQSAISRLNVNETDRFRINGREYGSVGDIFEFQEEVYAREPDTMVLSHGDEHFDNILYGEHGYRVIDGVWHGHYDPAWPAALIYSRSFLFHTTYPETILMGKHGCVASFEMSIFQPNPVEKILSLVRNYGGPPGDKSYNERFAVYTLNAIGRSIGYMRYKSLHPMCEKYGRQHFLQAVVEMEKIINGKS